MYRNAINFLVFFKPLFVWCTSSEPEYSPAASLLMSLLQPPEWDGAVGGGGTMFTLASSLFIFA